MPYVQFAWQKVLRISVGLAQRFPALGDTVRLFHVIDPSATLFIFGIPSRSSSFHSLAGPSCCLSSLQAKSGRIPPFISNIMSASSYLSGGFELGSHKMVNLNWRRGLMMMPLTRVNLCFHNKGLDCRRKAIGSMNDRESGSSNIIYKCFSSSVTGSRWNSEIFLTPGLKDFRSLCSASFSAEATPDVSLEGLSREEQLQKSAASSEESLASDRSLMLLSGSCYLPHPDKMKTGGEDAHFICDNEQAVGVADGVGGWAEQGIDAGKYARELMSHSVTTICNEPKGSIDPASVLEKAYSRTKAKGSSTACIIALRDQVLHAINLGDSGFIVVRDGSTIFRSPLQQHDFNFPYQLECSHMSDLPSSGEVFAIHVAAGDVMVAGTDGLFDNLYPDEVTDIVVDAFRAGLDPQVAAQKVAACAQDRALNKEKKTPFSAAAQDIGLPYYGGKLDDITVVVSYINASGARD